MTWPRQLVVLVVAAALGACLFSPKLEEHGYLRCADDAECAAGRACYSGLCTPPPWHDEAFAKRQLLVVENESRTLPLVAGSAAVVRIGDGGLLETSAIGVDGRLTRYSFATDEWSDVPVWRDIYDDYLLMYVPIDEELPRGGAAALAWIESQTGTREPALVEDAARVFPLLFEALAGDALDDAVWASFGTGAPIVGAGRVNVGDNQKLVLQEALEPPFSVTWKGRINGLGCSQTFLGLVSGDGAGFETPSVGFFVQQELATILEVAPRSTSAPQQPGDVEGLTLDTALHRFRIDVAEQKVRWSLDDTVVGEPAAVQFIGEQLYFIVDVDGDCSFDLELVHAAPLPFTHPVVRAEEAVEYELFE